MKHVCLQNVLALSRFELKTTKKQILSWALAMFGVMFLYMILFSSMQEMAQVKMEAMPKELLQFVGMEDFTSLANYLSYFGMIFNLVLIAISLFATTYASSLISKEEQSKSIEFLSALPISRLEVFLAKTLAASASVLLLLASSAIAAFLCGVLVGGETFVMMDFIQIVKISSLSAFVFMGVGLCVAGASAKISASAVGSFVVLFSYVLGFLSSLLEDKVPWLAYASPFEMLSPKNAMALSSQTLVCAFLYLLLLVLLVTIGARVYQKRDL